MMRRFRGSTAARRERRWRVRRESEDDEREPEELILGFGGRDNEASQTQAHMQVRTIAP